MRGIETGLFKGHKTDLGHELLDLKGELRSIDDVRTFLDSPEREVNN